MPHSGHALSRKSFLAGAAAVPFGMSLVEASDARARNSGGPNVVLILFDDLGYGDLSCYGSQAISTPNADRLAEDGVRLTQAYSGAPVCTPSRAALMTGRYGARSGLQRTVSPGDARGMPDGERTIAEYLRRAGYATGCFGKWHLGSRPEHNPTRHGFDRFFGVLHSNDMEPFRIYDGEEVVEFDVEQAQLTRRYTEEASAFIRENSGGPFFAYLPHTMPHIPIHAEERFRGVSEAGPYGDAVEAIDHYLGNLVDVLEDEEALEDTLILLSSDNGPWFTGSTGGLRGRKGETYEGGMRVPTIAHWPAGIQRGTVSDYPVSSVDFLPTLCSLAGVEPEGDIILDGEDVSAALRGREEGERDGPIYFFTEKHLNAVRRGRWKLHIRRVPEGGYSPTQQMPQLFDLESDSSESYDLSETRPEIVEELRSLLEQFESEVNGASSRETEDQAFWRDWLPGF